MPDRVKTIVRETCKEAGVNPATFMRSKSTKRADCLPRWKVWAKVRSTITMADGRPPSYPQMGVWFDRHHTTIMDGVKRASQ